MRSQSKPGVLLALILAACNSAPVITNVVQDDQGPAVPHMDPALMEKMMKYAAPGEHHEMLAEVAGTYGVACKMFMGPDAPPMSMQATAESQAILGGRFLRESFEGDMMGQPFEGQLMLGYNNLDQQYFAIWMDTWGTGFSLAQGKAAADGTLELRGQMRDALTPAGRPYRHVVKRKDKDHYTVELWDTMPDGKEWKTMEMEYSRK
jgi:hypothetical protein